VVWRGIVLGLLAVAVGPLTALAVSTAGFAAWHWRVQGRGCSVHLLTGAVFGAACLLGGLAAAILAHGVYNVLVDWAVLSERARLRGP
jgi:membrane protease YdiL (CAAX protease family)